MNSNLIDFLNLFRQNLILNYVYFFGLPTHPRRVDPGFSGVDLAWHL